MLSCNMISVSGASEQVELGTRRILHYELKERGQLQVAKGPKSIAPLAFT